MDETDLPTYNKQMIVTIWKDIIYQDWTYVWKLEREKTIKGITRQQLAKYFQATVLRTKKAEDAFNIMHDQWIIKITKIQRYDDTQNKDLKELEERVEAAGELEALNSK